MPDTAIELEFGDGHYRFWLPMKWQIAMQQAAGGKSPFELYDGMCQVLARRTDGEMPVFVSGPSTTNITDIREVIRCAAIGGGLHPNDARSLVETYVDDRPLAETLPIAWSILDAAIRGVSLKKKVRKNRAVRGTNRSTKAKS